MAFSKPKAFERAERFAAKGQHDKAAREYQSIVENDPKDVRAWLMLADCLVRCGDKVGAVERYERVAQYYMEAKEHNKALAVLRQVVALDAQRLDVQIKMAALNLQVGHTQDGIAIYERVAHAQLQLGRVADALNTYKLVADADPTVVARRLRLAELYSREKRNAEAVEAFRAAGRQLRLLGRLPDLVRVLERLLYHDENDLPAVRDLARAYLELSDPRRALVKLNGLLRAHPKDEEGIELLADTFMALGKPEKALSALEELARALRAKGPAAKADAIRVLRRGLEWRPGHAEFREWLTELEGRRRSPTAEPSGPQPQASDADELGIEAVEEGDLVELDEDDVVMDDGDAEPASVSLPEAASIAPGTRRTVEVEALPSTEPSLTQTVLSEVEARAELAAGGRASDLEVTGDGEGLTDFDKILFEAKVYIKYRLFEHALEHVRTALQQQPEHVGAMTVQAKALAELGRAEDAAEVHLDIAELVAGRDPKLAREQLAAARGLVPEHPRLDEVARFLGPATPVRVTPVRPRLPVEDDGDSGAFDVVSDDFGDDLSPPGIALDLADEPRASLAPAEDEVHTTQPYAPNDAQRAQLARVREHTPAAGFVARPPEDDELAEGPPPRRRLTLGRSPEAPTSEPSRTGRTLTTRMPGRPAARLGDLELPDPEQEPAQTGRTLLYGTEPEPEPARTGRTLVHEPEPEPARTGRTLVHSPVDDDDDDMVSGHGLDFDGDLDFGDASPRQPEPTSIHPEDAVSLEDSEGSVSDMVIDVEPEEAEEPGEAEEPEQEHSEPAIVVEASESAIVVEASESAIVVEASPSDGDWVDLSDELEEIQFYVDQGLDEDAEAALDDLEAQHPGHPQIARFRGQLPGHVAAEPEPEPEPEVEDEPYHAEAEVEAEAEAEAEVEELPESMLDLDLEPIEVEDEAEAAEPLVSFDEQPSAEPLVSFDDDDDEDAYLSAIFADPVKPKAKARTDDSSPGANVAEGQAVDAATAFDLGVAYREMGLVDAAIAQFETAASDPQWRARALTLLGALRVHRGETDQAITDLKEAVRLASTPSEASEAAYELGVLYEVIGDTEAAIQQLLTVAPGYRDRDERLSELGF